MRENLVFRPAGACLVPTFPHGLRRGLRSYAASRLITWRFVPPRPRHYSSHAHTKSPALSHRTRKGQGTQVSDGVGQLRLHQATLSLIASLNCSTAPIICSGVMMAGGAITK